MTTIKIKYPCSERWETMKLGQHSRYCENCKKDIIDFTTKTREEILSHILTNQGKQICGRLYPSQLDFAHTDILIAIQGLSPKQKSSNLPFYLLTIGTLLISGCSNTPSDPKSTAVHIDSASVNSGSGNAQHNGSSYSGDPHESPTVGIIIIESDTVASQKKPYPDKEPYQIVDKMPEFVGGIDSLVHYLENSINYPEWELKHKIEGTVFVSFIVEKTGKIKQAKITETVKGSKNFDAEVLRVVNKMPHWIPGELHHKKVDVQYHLPIKFVL